MALKTAIIRTTAAAVLTAVTIIGGTSAGVAGELSRSGSVQTIEDTTLFQPETTSLTDLKAPEDDTNEVIVGDFTPEQPTVLGTGEIGSLSGGRTSFGDTRFDAADDFKAGPGCSIQCITSGKAYARGVGVKLVVKTDTNADIAITVWDGNGYYRVLESDGETMRFETLLNDLDPGTTYQAAVTAEDSQGYVSEASGHFETLTRNVQIFFNTATINAAPYSNGSYMLDLWAEGEWLYPTVTGLTPEGDTLPLGIYAIQLNDVDQHLDFSVQLTQADMDPDICQVEPGRGASPSIGSLPVSCVTWAYATFFTGLDDLDARPDDATSWTEHSLDRLLMLPFGYGGYALDFTVPVQLHVTYE